jgi:formylglycine-generating enzyme required for sulfatase activity
LIGATLLPALLLSRPTGFAGQALQPFSETLPDSVVKLQMNPIQGGDVVIGTKTVTVKPFWMSTTEIPWEAIDVFLSSGPPSKAYDQRVFAPDAIARPSKSYILPDLGWGHNGYPAINVSFTSVEMFCRWLSSVTKKKYRVPTEAEWELACRAGVTGNWKIDKAQLEKSAWYAGNAEHMTHPVGKKQANKFGLFDTLGNAGEWATDLEGKPVLCGGTFLDPAADIGPSTRKRWSPKWQETDPQIPKSRWWLADGSFVGFRLVCEP